MLANKWLLLLYGLPTEQSAERVSLWRRLKKFGALQLKTSAYVLPDKPLHFERFQWLAKQVRDHGGDATLIRATEIEGVTNDELIRLFNKERSEDYGKLIKELTRFVAQNKKKKKPAEAFPVDLQKFNRRFNEIREADYFECPSAHDAEMLLKRADGLSKSNKSKSTPLLKVQAFQGKTWLTRPRPEIDRVGSAWLIRKFIDPQATFVFAKNPKDYPQAIPYDVMDVEFTHHGEDCTFETLVKRFGLHDKTILKIAEMIHDADLEDGKFQRTECVGLDALFKGWAIMGITDDELIKRGADCFEALYSLLK
jgi:hypothetical protein